MYLPLTRLLLSGFVSLSFYGSALAQGPAHPVTDTVKVHRSKPVDQKVRTAALEAFQLLQSTPRSTVHTQPVSMQRGDNSCNLVTNGDFEDPNAIPPAATGAVRSPRPGSTDNLPYWYAANYASPDYIANNATNPDVIPNTSVRGGFPPLGNTAQGGTAGIAYTPDFYNTGNPFAEYIAQNLSPNITAGDYYAEFNARPANHYTQGRALHLYVAVPNPDSPNSGTITTDYRYNNDGFMTPYLLPYSGNGIISPIITDINSWTRVSGIVRVPANANFLCIGYDNPTATPTPIPNAVPPVVGASYYYLDDVAFYKIPTAGLSPSVPCGSSVILGEGCAIPGATYAWTIGSGAPFATTLQTTVAPTATTTYTLTVTLPDGSKSVSSVTVTGCPSPCQTLPGPISACNNSDSGRLTAEIAPISGATSYNWYKNGVLNTTSKGSAAIWTIPRGTLSGTVTVSVEGVFACGTSPRRTQNFPNQSGACSDALRVSSYPNPTADALTVTGTGQDAQLYFYDMQGVVRKHITLHGENTQTTINTRDLPTGKYVLRTVGPDGTTSQKIIIQH